MESRSTQPLRWFLWIAVMLAICIPAHASNACPWMNEATASGLLGDEAVGSYTAASSTNRRATCRFTQGNGAAVRTLVLEVESIPDASTKVRSMQKTCSSAATTLQAIGNEAVVCAADDGKSRLGEFVVGRVRDQMFTIRISSSLKNDPVLTREALRNRISSAAEQIAGNLF